MIKKVILYFTNQISLWYDKFRDRDRLVMEKDNKRGIFSAKALACYITKYYREKFEKEEISPLKLQKTLYFCFAYWGGFMRKNNSFDEKTKEISLDYDEYLFNERIEAWVYGPVIPEVYHEKNISDYEDPNLFDDKEYVKKYINNILDDVLPTNDFKLVEISHQDNCWKKHFKGKNMFHNIEIPKEEIIKEYAKIC